MAGNLRRRNGVTLAALAMVLVVMGGLVYASVPLYRLFCQVTGFGGTTRTAEAPPAQPGERIVTVRFNADVSRTLPWSFRPVQREISLRVGELGLAYYVARNESDVPITGNATYNVSPQKAGIYFNKVACFCFTEQRLMPGESVKMAVTFFVDPEIVDDPYQDDVKTITLSYTFFRAPEAEAGVTAKGRTAAAGVMAEASSRSR
ncbi:MAG: cytochrome c oxidase assembly protein [Proteobacteria bacterium]|nr:cytochrome c oxidase assembly protein [Pseudomonadota bacterium]